MDSYVVSPRDTQPSASLHAGPADSASHVGKVRVRVAHGVPLIGWGIGAVLAGSGEFEVVRSVGRSSGAADVLIADVEAGLNSAHRNTLIIAQDDGEAVIRKALQKGVRGFLLHTCASDELTAAVRALGRGGTAFAPWVANRIAQSFSFEPLSDRELEVLHLLMHGSSDKDMARKLFIAPGTVKSHVRSILTKLGASRRTEAAAIAQRRGIARLDRPFESATRADIRFTAL